MPRTKSSAGEESTKTATATENDNKRPKSKDPSTKKSSSTIKSKPSRDEGRKKSRKSSILSPSRDKPTLKERRNTKSTKSSKSLIRIKGDNEEPRSGSQQYRLKSRDAAADSSRQSLRKSTLTVK